MKRVLVVVADEAARQALCRDVEACGYKTIEAPGGRGAFRQAAMMKPHLILLDLPMSDMTVTELLGKLSGPERTAEIPVVAIAADASALEGQDARLAGVVAKGVGQAELKATLDGLLSSQTAI